VKVAESNTDEGRLIKNSPSITWQKFSIKGEAFFYWLVSGKAYITNYSIKRNSGGRIFNELALHSFMRSRAVT